MLNSSRVKTLVDKQREFQKAVGVPIGSILEQDRNRISEMFLFKAVEEIVELRKEFPSAMNPWSKNQKTANMEEVKKELCDVLLFLVNFACLWNFDPEDILRVLEEVQYNNFLKLKEKKLAQLNDEILRVPGQVSGVGSGSLFPKYIFVGQNPGETIDPGYKFFSNPEDGSSKVLLPILDEIGIREQSYFTNLVKCTTPKNTLPSNDAVEFWKEFLVREIEVLKYGCSNVQIIPMGTTVKRELNLPGIKHPATVLYGSISREDYKKELENQIGICYAA